MAKNSLPSELDLVQQPSYGLPDWAQRPQAQAVNTGGAVPFQAEFLSASQKYGVPFNVLMGLAEQESSFNPTAIGVPTKYGRAKGLMQYIDSTASRMGINPYDPLQSIDAAARQLRERLDKGYSMQEAVQAHFGGDDRNQWGPKTAQYGKDVLGRAEKFLGGGQSVAAGQPTQQQDQPQTRMGQIAQDYPPAQSAMENLEQTRQRTQALLDEMNKEEPGRYRPLTDEEMQQLSQHITPEMQQQAMQSGKPIEITIPDLVQPGQAVTAKQSVTQQPQKQPEGNKDGNLFTDALALLDSGMNTAAKDVQELVGKIPYIGKPIVDAADRFDRWANGKSSQELFKAYDENIERRLSPEMLAARRKSFVIEPGDDLGDGKKSTGYNFGPAWSDPRAYMSGILESLPEMALTMGGSGRLAQMAYRRALASGASREVAAKAAARTATVAGGILEGGLSGAQSSREVRDDILKMKPEQLANSDAMKSLMDGGLSFEQARAQLAENASSQAFMLAGISTGIFGGMGDRALAKIITNRAGGRVKAALAGALGEGVFEEMPQSATQQMSQNYAMQQADPNTPLMKGVANQAAGGLAVGGLMGAGMGAAAPRVGTDEQPAATQEQQPAQPVQAEQAQPAAQPEQTVQAEQPQEIKPSGPLARALQAGVQQTTEDVAAQAQQNTAAAENHTPDEFMGPVGAETMVIPSDDPESAFPAVVQEYRNGNAVVADQNGEILEFGPHEVVRPDAAADVAQQQPAQAVNEPVQQQIPVEQATEEQPRQPKAVSEMTEPELRDRLKYLHQQAKSSGGWNERLTKARREVEKAIDAKTAPVQGEIDAETTNLPDERAAQPEVSQIPQSDNASAVQPDESGVSSQQDGVLRSADEPAAGGRAADVPAGETANTDPTLNKDGSQKWFGTERKANEYLQKKGITGTHEIRLVDRRFEIHAKGQDVNQATETVNQTADNVKPAAESVKGKNGPRYNRAKKLLGAEEGNIVTPQEDIGYTSAGSQYRIDQIGKNGIVYLTNIETGSSTTVNLGELERAKSRKSGFNRVESVAETTAVEPEQTRADVMREMEQDDNADALQRLNDDVQAGKISPADAQTITDRAIAAAKSVRNRSVVGDYIDEARERLTGEYKWSKPENASTIELAETGKRVRIDKAGPLDVSALGKPQKPAVERVAETAPAAQEKQQKAGRPPLDVEALPLLKEHREDPLIQRFVEMSDRVDRTEKASDPATWTPEERRAYESGNYEEFSRLRGYTASEIADFNEFVRLAGEVDAKYGENTAGGIDDLISRQFEDRAPETAKAEPKPADFRENQNSSTENLRENADSSTRTTIRDTDGKQYEHRGEPLPKKGLATANIGSNGAVYVNKPSGVHFQLSEKYPVSERGEWQREGFVTPDGQFLDRTQALAWVNQNEGEIKPSDNMSNQLDAVDYREQAGKRPVKSEASEYGASNKLVSQDRAAELRKKLKAKFSQLNSGLDPEILAIGTELAVFHLEAGVRKFADFARTMASDLDVPLNRLRPYLRSWYNGGRDMMEDSGISIEGMDSPETVRAELAKLDQAPVKEEAPAQTAPKAENQAPVNQPAPASQARTTGSLDDMVNAFDNEVTPNVSGIRTGMEPDSRNATDAVSGNESPVLDGSGRNNRSDEQPGQRTEQERSVGQRDQRVSADGAASRREPGNQPVHQPNGQFVDEGRDAGNSDSSGSRSNSQAGSPVEQQRRRAIADNAHAAGAGTLERRLKAQKAAKGAPTTWADKASIDAALPLLLPEQRGDVLKIEQRHQVATGVLVTNGTGTGKTATGLGTAKRYFNAGKKNIAIVVPTDKVASDWVKFAGMMDMPLHQLKGIDDAGGNGPIVTTYANFGQNDALYNRQWDLIIPDESHYLSSNANGDSTAALDKLRGLTGHPEGFQHWLIGNNKELSDQLNEQRAILNKMNSAQAGYQAQEQKVNRLTEQWRAIEQPARREWQQRWTEQRDLPKVVFLSATPFAYVKNTDYAEGYLFHHTPPADRYTENSTGGYNSANDRERFYMEHFGYRMRYNKLTQPEAGVNTELMEQNFNQWLKDTGALFGRRLDVPFDYDRRFQLIDDAAGKKLDDALRFLNEAENGIYRPIYDEVMRTFDYQRRMFLLESMKARAAVPVIREHLKLGRKVVVFHDYNQGGGFSPFAEALAEMKDLDMRSTASELFQRPIFRINFSGLDSAINTIKKAFPNVLLFNGTVSKGKRRQNADFFNADKSGKNLILVQSDAGREGVSLHDTTGKHQRVEINLGMPVRPVAATQIEGRIYRTGQASDAIFRYMTTGTSWEASTFASKIAERAATAENLALGDEARGLKQSFIDAYNEAEPMQASREDGKGGKERDQALSQNITPFDKAKTFYWAQQKNTKRRDQREGQDYFATPEPVGLKMVEWANIKPGDKVLEPSAGHGAIARFFPAQSDVTMVEPSYDLSQRAALANGTARIINGRFEDLSRANKFDAIVMNPPFGTGGKTAYEHLAKAAKHLRQGGRLVALVPRGGISERRFDQFFGGDEAKGLDLVARIKMPWVTFERAGTKVATEVLVFERHDKSDGSIIPVRPDLSSAQTINELFDRIEGLTLPERQPLTADEAIANAADGTMYSVPMVQQQTAREFAASLRDEFPGLKIDLMGSGKVVTLSRIIVPNDSRNSGTGTAVMQRLTRWADQNGKTLALSPSGDFGGNKARLGDFYKRFGFVENKGRAKDYEISETMYREPQQAKFSVNSSQTDTPAFKRWFEGSKVVDESGNPQVMYHGTPEDFTVFNTSDRLADGSARNPMNDNIGAFFTSDRPDAEDFSARNASSSSASNIHDVYLAIKNPLVFEDQAEFRSYLRKNSREDMEKAGHDGIIINDVYEEDRAYEFDPDSDEYLNGPKTRWAIAFSPEQVKSASRNNGNFDSRNPDIRFSIAAARESLTEGSIGSTAKELLDSGRLELHSAPPSPEYAAAGGWIDPDGKIHLALYNLRPEDVQPTLMHELFHAGVRSIGGDRRWVNLMDRLGQYYRAAQNGGEKNQWTAAVERIQNAQRQGDRMNDAARDHVIEELGAYAVENFEKMPAGIRKWAESIIGAVKNYLQQTLGLQLGKVTPGQLRALAAGAIRNQKAPATSTSFSQPEASQPPKAAEKQSWFNQRWDEVADLPDNMLKTVMPALLRFTPGRFILKRVGKDIPALGRYADVKLQMDTLRDEWHAKTDQESQKWLKYRVSKPQENAELMSLMHDSTLAQVDPSKDFQSILNAIDLTALREKKRGDPAWDEANQKAQDDAKRKEEHGKLRERYNALSPEGKQIYSRVRDLYSRLADAQEQAIIDNMEKAMDIRSRQVRRKFEDEMQRITDEGLKGKDKEDAIAAAKKALNNGLRKDAWNRRARINQLRSEFESNRLAGPYFPLARFGDFFVTARKKGSGEVVSFSRTETAFAQTRLRKQLEKEGYDVETGIVSKSNDLRKQVPADFVARIEDLLKGIEGTQQTQDQVWQLYLQTMPDYSLRKSRIHRKGRAGFEEDALRAFASHMFHGSHQLARMKYSMELGDLIDQAEREAKRTRSPVRSGLVVEQARMNHDYVMNPTSNRISQVATQGAFLWYLAQSPAAALVNMSQTFIVAPAKLAAFYDKGAVAGIPVALGYLNRAMFDLGMGRTFAEKSARVTPEEKKAVSEAYRMGLITRTQSHDVAGIGDSGVKYSPIRAKLMAALSFMFHHTERINREATFLAAYRMAKKRGLDPKNAIRKAADLTWDSHYDYQNSSRPAIMHSNTGKALLVFRNYSLNMLADLAYTAYEMINPRNKQERREARTQMLGLGATLAFNAGIRGLPLYGLLMAIAGMFSDDGDDPEVELKKTMLQYFPKQMVGIMMDGVPGYLSGVELSGRIGFGDLWFRSDDMDREGDAQFLYWLQQVLGASAGIPYNWYRGVSQINDGYTWRGIETMVPKAIKDPMKAWRYYNEGVSTKNGDPIVDDVGGWNIFKQAMGFTPAKVTEQYKMNSYNMNKQKAITEERSKLLGDFYKAWKSGDEKKVDQITDKMREYSEKYPEMRIDGGTVRSSLARREKYRGSALGGMNYNQKLVPRLQDEQPGTVYR